MMHAASITRRYWLANDDDTFLLWQHLFRYSFLLFDHCCCDRVAGFFCPDIAGAPGRHQTRLLTMLKIGSHNKLILHCPSERLLQKHSPKFGDFFHATAFRLFGATHKRCFHFRDLGFDMQTIDSKLKRWRIRPHRTCTVIYSGATLVLLPKSVKKHFEIKADLSEPECRTTTLWKRSKTQPCRYPLAITHASVPW